jgi:glyoxylase-like metal-dependent hydrolase (beta-lactamase superfamily II)
MMVTTEKLGEGLYRLTTGPGSYDSVVVEFKDHVMMLEAGQSEARGLAYIAETKKLFPNKPIRYVMNTHPHSDHTGGLPRWWQKARRSSRRRTTKSSSTARSTRRARC